jgi:CheY-like chemotaxis protein
MAPMRILLVDDEWDNLECVQELLRSEFEVVAACGGAAGIECLRDQRFDAAVLDLTMPEVDGFEVMRVIRRSTPAMPVLLASALPNLQLIAEAVGAQDWLRKPFRFSDLVSKLHGLAQPRAGIANPAASTS